MIRMKNVGICYSVQFVSIFHRRGGVWPQSTVAGYFFLACKNINFSHEFIIRHQADQLACVRSGAEQIELCLNWIYCANNNTYIIYGIYSTRLLHVNAFNFRSSS